MMVLLDVHIDHSRLSHSHMHTIAADETVFNGNNQQKQNDLNHPPIDRHPKTRMHHPSYARI